MQKPILGSPETLAEVQDVLVEITDLLAEIAHREDSFVLGKAVGYMTRAIALIYHVQEARAESEA